RKESLTTLLTVLITSIIPYKIIAATDRSLNLIRITEAAPANHACQRRHWNRMMPHYHPLNNQCQRLGSNITTQETLCRTRLNLQVLLIATQREYKCFMRSLIPRMENCKILPWVGAWIRIAIQQGWIQM